MGLPRPVKLNISNVKLSIFKKKLAGGDVVAEVFEVSSGLLEDVDFVVSSLDLGMLAFSPKQHCNTHEKMVTLPC